MQAVNVSSCHACCEGMPEGVYKGATMEKGNEFKQTWNGAHFSGFSAPVELALIFLDVEQQQTLNDMLLAI